MKYLFWRAAMRAWLYGDRQLWLWCLIIISALAGLILALAVVNFK